MISIKLINSGSFNHPIGKSNWSHSLIIMITTSGTLKGIRYGQPQEKPGDWREETNTPSHHVSLLSQACGCFNWDHQERHTRCRLRGQIHCKEVSIKWELPTEMSCFVLFLTDLNILDSYQNVFCLSSSLGVIGVSMVTIVERQSISSKRWSPHIRKHFRVIWRARTALCLYPSRIVPRHLPRRVWSKKKFPVTLARLTFFFFAGLN